MRISEFEIAGVRVLSPTRHEDARGWFSETYNKRVLSGLGIAVDFVQDNESLSAAAGTIRGLHFQAPPAAQDKLIRVVSGSIFDVSVDIRRGSPTFGQFVSVTLSATEGNQLYVPAGFAHGFCTLEPTTRVAYKVSNYYSAEHDHGLLWNDPAIGIDWPASADDASLSDKDRGWPLLAELDSPFDWQA